MADMDDEEYKKWVSSDSESEDGGGQQFAAHGGSRGRGGRGRGRGGRGRGRGGRGRGGNSGQHSHRPGEPEIENYNDWVSSDEEEEEPRHRKGQRKQQQHGGRQPFGGSDRLASQAFRTIAAQQPPLPQQRQVPLPPATSEDFDIQAAFAAWRQTQVPAAPSPAPSTMAYAYAAPASMQMHGHVMAAPSLPPAYYSQAMPMSMPQPAAPAAPYGYMPYPYSQHPSMPMAMPMASQYSQAPPSHSQHPRPSQAPAVAAMPYPHHYPSYHQEGRGTGGAEGGVGGEDEEEEDDDDDVPQEVLNAINDQEFFQFVASRPDYANETEEDVANALRDLRGLRGDNEELEEEEEAEHDFNEPGRVAGNG